MILPDGQQGAHHKPEEFRMRKYQKYSVLAVAVVGALFGVAQLAIAVEQPHMEAALQALENAKHEIELADANHDHGGHAGAATQNIERAIHEVREGIRFRNNH
jgi:hypothetical protein